MYNIVMDIFNWFNKTSGIATWIYVVINAAVLFLMINQLFLYTRNYQYSRLLSNSIYRIFNDDIRQIYNSIKTSKEYKTDTWEGKINVTHLFDFLKYIKPKYAVKYETMLSYIKLIAENQNNAKLEDGSQYEIKTPSRDYELAKVFADSRKDNIINKFNSLPERFRKNESGEILKLELN